MLIDRIPALLKVITGIISFWMPINTSHSRFSVPKIRTTSHYKIVTEPFFRVILSLSIIWIVPSYRMLGTDTRDTIFPMNPPPLFAAIVILLANEIEYLFCSLAFDYAFSDRIHIKDKSLHTTNVARGLMYEVRMANNTEVLYNSNGTIIIPCSVIWINQVLHTFNCLYFIYSTSYPWYLWFILEWTK